MSPDFDEIDILQAELLVSGYRGDTSSAKGPARNENEDYEWLGNDIWIAGPRGAFSYRSKDLDQCWKRAWIFAFGSGGCAVHGGHADSPGVPYDEECIVCQFRRTERQADAWEHLAHVWRARATAKDEEATQARKEANRQTMACIIHQMPTPPIATVADDPGWIPWGVEGKRTR